jgi:hypothetical protein
MGWPLPSVLQADKAIVQASIAFFGMYMVDEAAKTLTLHIESCSLFRSPARDQSRATFRSRLVGLLPKLN